MKKFIQCFMISIFVMGLFSCNKDDSGSSPRITTFTANLKGANEVPESSSTSTGAATLLFNNTTKVFSIALTHNIVALTGGHIHTGAAGTNGPVVFTFSSLTSPISFTSNALTPAQEAELFNNLNYVNLHSATFPGGEIRGQLIKGATTGGNGSSGGGGY